MTSMMTRGWCRCLQPSESRRVTVMMITVCVGVGVGVYVWCSWLVSVGQRVG